MFFVSLIERERRRGGFSHQQCMITPLFCVFTVNYPIIFHGADSACQCLSKVELQYSERAHFHSLFILLFLLCQLHVLVFCPFFYVGYLDFEVLSFLYKYKLYLSLQFEKRTQTMSGLQIPFFLEITLLLLGNKHIENIPINFM